MKVASTFHLHCILLTLASTLSAVAAPRTSAHYEMDAETLDSGGARAASVRYGNIGSFGGGAGIQSNVTQSAVVKNGYLGQITDSTGLQIYPGQTLNLGGPTVNEGASIQLSALEMMDDGTRNKLPVNAVSWTIDYGPITSIGTGGLVNAGLVYEDSLATIACAYFDQSTTLDMTVKNINLDNFGSYSGDGLDDAWQVQYFGLNSPNATPSADPDGDGQPNAVEFAAGVVPNDPTSLFQTWVESVPEQPQLKRIVFSPRLSNRTYSLEYETDLTLDAWTPLTGTTQIDNGLEREVTDPDGAGAAKFYRVRITKP